MSVSQINSQARSADRKSRDRDEMICSAHPTTVILLCLHHQIDAGRCSIY